MENPVFKSIRLILDLEFFPFHDTDMLYDKVKVVAVHFKSMFTANDC